MTRGRATATTPRRGAVKTRKRGDAATRKKNAKPTPKRDTKARPRQENTQETDAAVITLYNSQPKRSRGKPFVKNDPRINRQGRPKNHDELRQLIQAIAAEEVGTEGDTQIAELVREMFKSRSPADHQRLLEHGWGKVPDETKLTGDKRAPVAFRVIYGDDDPAAQATPAPKRIYQQSGETQSDCERTPVGQDDGRLDPGDGAASGGTEDSLRGTDTGANERLLDGV